MWDYTPLRTQAFLELARRLGNREKADQLSLARLAAHGDGDDVKKTIDRLTRS